MSKGNFRYPMVGVVIGLILGAMVFLICCFLVMEDHFKTKSFYYDGFLFREKCREKGMNDLQSATERFRIIHNRADFDHIEHPDVKNGHPEAFIRGTLGYNLWDGFRYGEKPGRLETFFEYQTMKGAGSMVIMLRFPFLIILILPFAGGLIGYKWRKKSGVLSRPGFVSPNKDFQVGNKGAK